MERIDAELLDTPRPRRGRGAVTAPAGRFAASRTERRADGWDTDPMRRRSATASTFAASLELAKEGKIEMRQGDVFSPIQIRKRDR